MNGVVRTDGAGGISWHSQNAIVLGPITFDVNDVRFTVDAAFPAEVVGLTASSSDAMRAAAQWFRDPSVIERIAAGVDGTTTVGPVLVDQVARVATVHAVDAIHLGDLDDGVLLLDHAYAFARASDIDAAQHFYALSSAVADRLVDEIDANGYFGPLVHRVKETILAAPEQTFDVGSRSWMLSVLDARSGVEEGLWISFQRDASSEIFSLAIDLGELAAIPHRRTLADLRTLWPRVLAFMGPDEPEVEIAVHPEAIDMSAGLRRDVIVDSTEVAGIFAVVADAATGDLLAYSPTRVVDRRVQATVRVAAEPDTIRCAFIRSGVDLGNVRLDAMGAALNRIDRHCRYAWTQHRRAEVLRGSVGVNEDESQISTAQRAAEQAHRQAVDTIATAMALTRQLVRRQRKSPGARELVDYQAALERLSGAVNGPSTVGGPTGPTLAELYAEVFA